MAKKKKAKVKPTQKYIVVVLECAHCGEEVHQVKSCNFCNAEGSMKFKKHLLLTKEELQKLYDDLNAEIEGDVRAILREDDDEKVEDDDDTSSFSEDEVGRITLDDL